MASNSEDFVWTSCARPARPLASMVFGLAAVFSISLLLVNPPKAGLRGATTGGRPLMMHFDVPVRPAFVRELVTSEHVLPRPPSESPSEEPRSAMLPPDKLWASKIKASSAKLARSVRKAATTRPAKKATGNRVSRKARKNRRVWVVIRNNGTSRGTLVRGWLRNGRLGSV
jgi:hypothetical protein